MDATGWVKLRAERHLSWHIDVPEPDAAPDVLDHWTRCGRWADADALTADDLPLGERSCESCARLVIHDAERASASRKGRMHPGEANGIAKLTDDAVRAIRRDYRPGTRGELRRLARQHGVTDGAIRFVIRHETWRHLTEVVS